MMKKVNKNVDKEESVNDEHIIQSSDDDDDDDIKKRHKNERKQLQAKIMNLKRSVAKSDKKRKRETAEEIAKLEADLELRHQEQHNLIENINGLNSSSEQTNFEKLESTLRNVNIDEDDHVKVESTTKPKKISKAQKRRNKKELNEKLRDELIRSQEKVNLSGARHLEAEKLKSMLDERGLAIHEIPSDGDCLYGAISHQLSQYGITMMISDLRQTAAQFIRQNKDEFEPFLCDPESGLQFTDEKFEAYCYEIATTPAWGGQLELRAISQMLKQPIQVLQADGRPLLLGEEFPYKKPLIITYHRHTYKLGEHFNSVAAMSESSLNDDRFLKTTFSISNK